MAAKDAPKDAPTNSESIESTTKVERETESVNKHKFDVTKLNTLSLVSLGFSLIGGALPALAFGYISLAQIKKTHQEGRSVAIVSLVLAYIQISLAVIFGIIWVVAAISAMKHGVYSGDFMGGAQGFGPDHMGGPQGFGPEMMGDNR